MLIALLSITLADSPITSTDLSVGYGESLAVQRARSGDVGAVTSDLLGDSPLSERLAIVDALGWKGDGRAEILLAAIAEKRGRTVEDLRLVDVLPAERVVLAYLLAHDHYMRLEPMAPGDDPLHNATPLALATSGANAMPDDFAAHAVVALIDAQAKMDGSWCAVWTAWRTLLERFPESKRNMAAASVQNATAYLKLYEDDCGPATTATADSPELNQVYALTEYDGKLVAGTQGGLVIWDGGRVAASREEKICSSVVVWNDAVWAGCYHRLIKYDGDFSTVSFDGKVREGGSYDVFLDASGELVARRGEVELRPGPDGVLAPTGKPLAGFDVLFVEDGSTWSVDFLAAIEHGATRYELQTSKYPGRDPRGFYRDPRKRLWVHDFESGFFLYDEEQDLFRRVPGVEQKASDIRVDATRDRVWMLHYTQGPVLLTDNQRGITPFDLSAQEYMRALHLADDGTLYVGGWHGITRIRIGADGQPELTTFTL